MRKRKQTHPGNEESDGTTKKSKETNNNNKVLNCKSSLTNDTINAVLVIIFYLLLSFVVYAQHQYLPTPVEKDVDPTIMSEMRAFDHVDAITKMGVRTVGSHANEKTCPEYIERAIREAASGSPREDQVDIEIQHVSGSFHLDFIGGFANAYEDVTNVIVRLRSSSGPSKGAILLNSHFDSALGTVAASDDVVQVAIMIEVFRSLVWSTDEKNVDVIFLFNGAEEAILQAAHGFLKHSWASYVSAVINLEAAGSGGREVLFQTGPGNSWIAESYANAVPYPHGSSVYQDVFQSGIVPSDTDFRVFRDFGDMVGVDIAFVEDGWAYHTSNDNANRLKLRPGSIQRCGENVLSLTKELSRRVALGEERSNDDRVTFFDVCGFVMFVVSVFWIRVGCVIAVVLIAIWCKKIQVDVLRSFRHFVKRSFYTVVAPVIVSLLLVVSPLRWYANPWLVLPLFVAPSWAAALWSLENDMKETSAWTSFMMFFMFLALLTCYFELGFSYLPVIWCVSCISPRIAFSKKNKCLVVLLGSVLPLVLTSQLLFFAFDFFIPLMGRAGTEAYPDTVIAILSAISVLILTSTTISLIGPQIRHALIRILLFITVFGYLYASLIAKSYSKTRPKRIYGQHISRHFQEEQDKYDSGLWINGIDWTTLHPLNYLRRPQEEEQQQQQESKETHQQNQIMTCTKSSLLYCDLPWYLPIKDMVRNGWYLPGESIPPSTNMFELIVLKVENKRVYFQARGASHMTFYLRGSSDNTKRLVAWSLYEGTPQKAGERSIVPGEQDFEYFIYFASGRGDIDAKFEFWVEFDGEDLMGASSKIDVAGAGHYLETPSLSLQALEKKLPSWTTFVGWVSAWEKLSVELN